MVRNEKKDIIPGQVPAVETIGEPDGDAQRAMLEKARNLGDDASEDETKATEKKILSVVERFYPFYYDNRWIRTYRKARNNSQDPWIRVNGGLGRDLYTVPVHARDPQEEIEFLVHTVAGHVDSMAAECMLISLQGKDTNVEKIETLRSSDGSSVLNVLHPLRIKLSERSREELRRIATAQGGVLHPEGRFRFERLLADKNIQNCPYCGEIWQARTEEPVKCPLCKRLLGKEG